MANCFGGASQQEKAAQAQSQSLANALQANYTQEFGEQQDVLQQLNTELTKIESGTTGPGFSADELAARRADIVNNAAAAERNATQAARNASAGQVFLGAQDSSGLARTSAIQDTIAGEIGAAGEAEKSRQLNALNEANYAQGRANAAQRVAGLNELAGRYNPAAYAGEATGAANQAFTQADKIRSESGAAMLGGLLTSGLKLGTSFISGGLTNLAESNGGKGESFFQSPGDFFSGGIDALSRG